MARRNVRRSRLSKAADAAVFEGLEARRMLSGASYASRDLIEIEWDGRRVEAIAGEWIVSLKRPEPTRGADGEVVQFNERWSRAQTPSAEIAPMFDRMADRGIRFGRYLGAEHVFTIEAVVGTRQGDLVAELEALPGFVAVEPNAVLRLAATTPDDTDFSDQYALHNTGQTGGTSDADIDAPEAWDLATGSKNVVVAVIDSGINYNHEDLIGNRWRNTNETNGNSTDDDGNGLTDDYYGYDFFNGDGVPLDDHDIAHGTRVAGIVAATGNNATGVSGTAWNTTLLPVKAFGSDGSTSTDAVEDAFNYVNTLRDAGANIRVINASFGGGGWTALQTAMTAAADRDILVVTTAGNNGNGQQSGGWNNDLSGQAIYPSSYTNDNIISVAATDDDDALASYSNWGPTSVDLAAPGSAIMTTISNGSYDSSRSGTSFAAPMVSGVAALAFSMKPDLTYGEVRGAILANVDTLAGLSGLVATGGRLNAFNTLDYIKDTYRPLWKRVVIGDAGGVKKTDYFNVRVLPGDPNTTQVQISGDGVNWTQYTTLNNSATYEIAIFPLAGSDHVTVEDGVLNRIYVNGGDQGDEILTRAAADRIYGGAGNDTLDGYSADDVIYGQGGNDTIYGQGGADYLDGGIGDDWISGSTGTDSIHGQDGADTLYAGTGSDYVRGEAGNDVFHTSGDSGYVDTGSGDEGTDDILDIDSFDTITQD